MDRRDLLETTAASLASLGLAGCSTFFDETQTAQTTPGGRIEQTTVDGSDRRRNDLEMASADHLVVVANRREESQRVTLTVTERKTDISLYQWGSTLEPGFDEAVYTLEDADPDGVQSYEVTLSADSASESLILWTNQCYGDATLEVTADGTVTGSVETC